MEQAHEAVPGVGYSMEGMSEMLSFPTMMAMNPNNFATSPLPQSSSPAPQTPPPRFSMGVHQPSPRGIRSACDFCHKKRIKCKRDEGGSTKCQQCVLRNIPCHFSAKEKTGPKPKASGRMPSSRSPSPSPNRFIRSPAGFGRPPRSPEDAKLYTPQVMGLQLDPSIMGSTAPASPCEVSSPPSRGRPVARAPVKTELGGGFGQGPAPNKDHQFLTMYLTTVGQLLPFCESPVLAAALDDRVKGNHNAVNGNINTNGGAPRVALLTAALAIGALISHDNAASEDLHHLTRAHLKMCIQHPSPDVAAALCMLAFYCQYKGEESKKESYMYALRTGLKGARPAPDIMLCIEYLDLEKGVKLRPDARRLPPRRRALHVISSMLSAMKELLHEGGHAVATLYCKEMGECAALLDNEDGAELTSLLCRSLHAFILVLLGRAAEASSSLDGLTDMLERHPLIMKALPLSWDTTLISATLCYLLGKRPDYMRLHTLVDKMQNTSIATQWTCRLPMADTPMENYLCHMCQSSSNICHIICEVGQKTGCGQISFYTSAGPVSMGSFAMMGEADITGSPSRRRKAGEVEDGLVGHEALSPQMPKSNGVAIPVNCTPKRRRSFQSIQQGLECPGSPRSPVVSRPSTPVSHGPPRTPTRADAAAHMWEQFNVGTHVKEELVPAESHMSQQLLRKGSSIFNFDDELPASFGGDLGMGEVESADDLVNQLSGVNIQNLPHTHPRGSMDLPGSMFESFEYNGLGMGNEIVDDITGAFQYEGEGNDIPALVHTESSMEMRPKHPRLHSSNALLDGVDSFNLMATEEMLGCLKDWKFEDDGFEGLLEDPSELGFLNAV